MSADPQTDGVAVRTHEDYYKALYQAALAFSSSLELAEVLEICVKSITTAMQVKASTLRLLDEHSGQLLLRASYGLSDHYIAKGPVNVQRSPIDGDVLAGTPIVIPDARTDPRFQYSEAAQREGLVTILSVPLEVRGRAIGVLRVYTGEPCNFHDDDIQFLSILGSLAALAIENANYHLSLKQSFDGVLDILWGSPA